MSRQKVLIGCPIHMCKEYAVPAYAKAVNDVIEHSKSFADIDVMLVDNTDDGGKFKNKIAALYPRFTVDRVNVKVSPRAKHRIHERICKSCGKIRESLIADKSYDWFFSLEIDVIPDKNCLEMLLDHGGDAVQGFFYGGFTREKYLENPFWLMGISLIKADIVRRIPFRYDMNLLAAHVDAFFGHDMHAEGVKTDFHPVVKARHIDDPKHGHRGWRRA